MLHPDSPVRADVMAWVLDRVRPWCHLVTTLRLTPYTYCEARVWACAYLSASIVVGRFRGTLGMSLLALQGLGVLCVLVLVVAREVVIRKLGR